MTKNLMRLPLSNVQYHPQAVGHRKRYDETSFHKNVQCHSQAAVRRKRCDKISVQKMCKVTHSLSVIGRDVRRLPFTKMQ